MEISAVCVSNAFSSNLYSPFSDQSHLQFYGHGTSRFELSCRPVLSLVSKPVTAPFRAQALCELACKAPMELTAEQALMRELVDLKLQMKQRKKELKAFMKEDKKRLKLQVKEEKRRKKQKDGEEGKTKMKCQSDSSSSSSESSEVECASVSMRTLREGQYMLEESRLDSGEYSVLESCVASSKAMSPSVVSKDDLVESSDGVFSLSSSDVVKSCTEESFRAIPSVSETCLSVSTVASSCNRCTSMPNVNSEQESVQKCRMSLPCNSRVIGGFGPTSHALPTVHTSIRIEVCAGGKCKKAGSELLLSALQGQIPGSSNVEAVPCKCMGKCGMAINVRVLKEDTNPQHHSHVGVEDGALILSHHFGLGRPPAGFPSFSSKDRLRAPSPLVTV